jgi:DnaJ-class molecular chaperone
LAWASTKAIDPCQNAGSGGARTPAEAKRLASALGEKRTRAGTQPGAVLRLRSKGLPRFGGRGRGDLSVRLAVAIPERLSAEERKVWERLRAMRAGR